MKMKKITALLLAALMLAGGVPWQMGELFETRLSASAQYTGLGFVCGDYKYELVGNGRAEVSKYLGSDTDIVIPAQLDGKTVTRIGDLAFSRSQVRSVTIPDSVTHIGVWAFYGCEELTSVNIPENVMVIDNGAFAYCKALKSMTVPDSVTRLGYSAFERCEGLTDVTLSKNIVSIEECTFEACTSLTDIVIPEGVTSIGKSAFDGCTDLKDITIPESVAEIGGYAFSGTAWLYDMAEKFPLVTVNNSMLFADGCEGDIRLPSGITAICAQAFMKQDKMTSIYLRDSVVKIDASAFYECTALSQVRLSNALRVIDARAFYGCTELKSILIPAAAEEIGEQAFGYYFGPKGETYSYNNKVEDLKIVCYKGTAGEKYAIENGFSYKLVNVGDVNNDGSVDILDVSKLMNHINGVKALDDDALLRADADISGTSDISDAAAIVNSINGVKALKYV